MSNTLALEQIALELAKLEKEKHTTGTDHQTAISLYEDYIAKVYTCYKNQNQ